MRERKSGLVLANSKDNPQSTPATEAKIMEVAKMISEGNTRETCIKYVMESKGVNHRQGEQYYASAMRYLIPDDMDGYKEEVIAKNFERLEKIVERGMKNSADLRLAKEAIAELNRMCGIGGNKVTMAKSKDGDEMIQITFD